MSAQARSGARRNVFPTRCDLESLCGFASAHAAFEASLLRIVRPVLPRIVERGEVRRFEIRDDAGCASTFEEISLPAAR